MKKANDEISYSELNELIFESLKNKFWQKGPKVRAELQKHSKKFMAKAEKNGWWDVLYAKDGRMLAFIAGWDERHPFWNHLLRPIEVYRRRGSKRALLWIDEKLRERRTFLNSRTEIHIPSGDRGLGRILLKNGFAIETVILIGEVNKSYRRLMQKKKPEKDLLAYGYSVSFLQEKKEVLQALPIEKNEFGRNPQFGWFLALPEVQRKRRKILMSAIRKGHTIVIKDKNEKVKGIVDFPVHSSEFYGDCGGVGLVLARELQGRGFAKIIYRILLEEFRRKKIKYFKGGTSQRPVMKLGKLMGRESISYVLRYGKGYFSPEYFGFSATRKKS